MGVSAALLKLMRGVPHDGIRLLTRDEAEGLELINAVAVREESARGKGAPDSADTAK